MNIHTGQRRPLPAVALVAVLLVLSLLVNQFWIAKMFPAVSGILGIDLMVVFLDIPVHLPVTVDLVPVLGLFCIFYPIVIVSYPSRTGRPARQEVWKNLRVALGGMMTVLVSIISGGLIFYLVQDHLPRRVRNGIDSFGINADLYIPYPGHETIQLRGSMLLLVCFIIGIRICVRKIRKGSEGLMQDVLTQDRPMPEASVRQEEPPLTKSGSVSVIKPASPAKQEIQRQYQALTVHEKLARMEAARQQEATLRQEEQALCYSQPVQSVRPVNYQPPANYSRSATS
jgi:hypothetical protein